MSACGGCGETNPDKRCIGCLHDFGGGHPMTQSPPTGELVARDIYEVANQLQGYVGPDTPEPLAAFLMREGAEAAKLADAITTLERELEEARAQREAADHALVDKYRNPKTGVFSFPGDVAAIVLRLYASQAEVERLKAALTTQAEEFAQIAERDTDWTLFSRQSKVEPLTGAETNVFAGPPDDGTYPTAKNVFAYTTGLAAGRAIAAAIRQRAALQVEESKG